MTTTAAPDIHTDAAEVTTRRLQLLGIPSDVIPGVRQYVDALNAAQLTMATTQYPHMLRGYSDASEADRAALVERATVADLAEWFDLDPTATGAGKYVQIVSMVPSGARSVHAVVIKATGQVCKSAGWRQGPAKSTAKATKGQPITRYTLTDLASLSDLLAALQSNPLNIHGGYLYSR